MEYVKQQRGVAFAEFEWAKVKCIRCYGLGRPTKSIEARCQLALLQLLSRKLGPRQCRCLLYDPVFEAVDEEVFRQLDLAVMSEEQAGDHAVKEPVLFYMPHCDAALYSDVLDMNWGVEALANVAILGNSFAHMQVGHVIRLCLQAPWPHMFKRQYLSGIMKVHVHSRKARSCLAHRYSCLCRSGGALLHSSGGWVSLPECYR
jgi:hypothetical protein